MQILQPQSLTHPSITPLCLFLISSAETCLTAGARPPQGFIWVFASPRTSNMAEFLPLCSFIFQVAIQTSIHVHRSKKGSYVPSVYIRLLTSLLDSPSVKTNHRAMLRVSDREDNPRVGTKEWDPFGDINNSKQVLCRARDKRACCSEELKNLMCCSLKGEEGGWSLMQKWIPV